MTVDSTTIWQKLERCVAVLTEPFTRQEITSWFRRHHPEVKEQSLSAHIQMATEGKATGAFTTRRPLVVRIDRGLYRRWRPSGQHLATAPAEDESAGGAIDVAADDAARRHFDRAMQEVYDRARDEVGYVATGFLRMLRNRGGVDTAHMLLRSSGVSDGFVALWEKGRPDLTVEALVLDDRFRHLFDDAELDVARRRLGR